MPNDPSPPPAVPPVLDTEVRQWLADHPAATLTDIEQVVDARMQVMRASWLAELIADTARREARCPTCGGPLRPRGEHSRTVRTQGDASIPLTRQYGVCPVCGTGLFPPR